MSLKKNIFFLFIGLILFSTFSFFVFNHRYFLALDGSIYNIVAGWSSPWWMKFNLVLSALGSGPALYFLCFLGMIFLALKGFKVKALIYGILLIIGLQVNALLKIDFARFRPLSLVPGSLWTTFAYPSGHAFGSLYFYGITLMVVFQIYPDLKKQQYWRWGLKGGALLLVLSIGLSRIALGAHWFSDVIGGYLLAFVWFFVARLVIRKF